MITAKTIIQAKKICDNDQRQNYIRPFMLNKKSNFTSKVSDPKNLRMAHKNEGLFQDIRCFENLIYKLSINGAINKNVIQNKPFCVKLSSKPWSSHNCNNCNDRLCLVL